ncbi:MAG: hypothetical protein ACLRPV_12980 [Lacrimispora saccharolytica]
MEEKLHYKMTIKLWKDDKVFGPGICQLLTKIEETGSMHTRPRRGWGWLTARHGR